METNGISRSQPVGRGVNFDSKSPNAYEAAIRKEKEELEKLKRELTSKLGVVDEKLTMVNRILDSVPVARSN